MKVLFIASTLRKPHASWHLLKLLMEKMLSKGIEIHAIQRKHETNSLEAFPETILNHKNFTYSEILTKPVDKKNFILRYLEGIQFSWRVRKHIKKNNDFDAIFLQPSFNAPYLLSHARAIAKKRPIIYNVQDIFPQNLMLSGQLPLSKIIYPIFSLMQRKAYKKADKIITISEDMKDTLINEGVPKTKIEVVYNWSYSDERITLQNIPAENVFDLKCDPNKMNIVYAGNIGKMQNVELVAKTARLSANDPFHFYIIGNGANKRNVEALVEGLDNVTLLPMQPANFAESIYAQADVNLIPLAKGGIKTALPSKTATILRTNTFAVFCIDKDSRFIDTVKSSCNIRVADTEDEKSLYEIIKSLRGKTVSSDNHENDKLFSLFSVNNTESYISIIQSAINERNL